MLNTLSNEEMQATVPAPTKAQTEERRRMKVWLEDRIAASKKAPSAEVVTLTPVLAELLIERNTDNRPISAYNENTMMSDVAGGRFAFNGESIVVSSNGVLIDGQHRCQVVIKTRQSIQTVIVFGPKEEARYTIDIGRPKSAGNFLAMKGHKYANHLAAAARLVLIYRHNNNKNLSNGWGGAYSPTKTEVVDAVEQLRGLETSLDFVSPAPRSYGGKGFLAFTHYIITKRAGRNAADEFFGKLFDMSNLPKGDPILACGKRLPNLHSSGAAALTVKAELIFKCWNLWRNNAKVHDSVRLSGTLPKLEA